MKVLAACAERSSFVVAGTGSNPSTGPADVGGGAIPKT